MSKLKNLISGIAVLAVIILFPSCKKILDKLFPDHDNKKPKECKIVKVKQYLSSEEDMRTGIVYHNAHGDPDSVIFDIETGSVPLRLFGAVLICYDTHNFSSVDFTGKYGRDGHEYQ